MRNLESGRRVEVLLVEDNDDDVMLTRLAIANVAKPEEELSRDNVRATVRLHVVPDGAQCLGFLRRAPPFDQAPRPDLIFLDLNMPVMDGRATLAAIGADEAMRGIPVVVLTTSAREEDVREVYRLRAAGYVVKPVEIERFFEVVRAVCVYWLSAVRLPARTLARA